MRVGFWQFAKAQYTTVPPVPKVDLTGKTVVVVGANAGLGFEAAKHFARMNPGKLILACRSKEKGEAALNAIKQETGCETAELWLIDLASFASVKSFAEKFEKEGGRLDILVENAANAPAIEKLQFTDDGWEASVQVNNLSTSLLALFLLPRMLETADKYNTSPRLVVVASEVHYWAVVDKDLLEASNPIRHYGHKEDLGSTLPDGNRYQITKLWNIFFVRALNDRLHRKPIIVNAVNPGYCYSTLRRNFSGLRYAFSTLMDWIFARTTEEGSRILVWAGVGAEEKRDELRGAYVSLMEVHEPSDFVISEEGKKAQDKFWDTLIEELSQVEPRVSQIVKESLTAPVNN
ncbi:hypothetical protein CVT26_003769 [Gymnopilus dilepis]|uniref:NAD(P)-binding protein n=1 Tax=Gymnopilus dilepis TaxID=231916 RepID=A0A409W1R3_9AGAR|nr:hypothetical protein CVT26_003769 [Gymnopilus dilepis]